MIRFVPRFTPALQALHEALRLSHYELLLQQCLGPDPSVALLLDSESEVQLSDRIQEQIPRFRSLFHLVLLEEPVRPVDLESQLSGKVLSDLVDLGLLVEQDGHLRTDFYRLIPYDGVIVAVHPRLRRVDAWGQPLKRLPSVYFGSDSIELCRAIRSFGLPERAKALDLCSGSGFVGIWMARAARCEVAASEVDAEALQVAHANAAMNGVQSLVQIEGGDLFQPFAGRKFDRIAANPPFIPHPNELGSMCWAGGGEDGFSVTRRILSQSPKFLSGRGVLHLVARVFGDANADRFHALLASELGERRPDAENVALLSQRRIVDPTTLHGLSTTSSTLDRSLSDEELESAFLQFQRHYSKLGLTHEFWAVLQLVEGQTGYRDVRLYDWLEPGFVFTLKPGLRLTSREMGFFRLMHEDGTELTSVPTQDREFLLQLDGWRSVRELETQLKLPVGRGLSLIRTYWRAGALEWVENRPAIA